MEVCCQEREIYANDTEAVIQPECPEYFEPWGSKCYHFSPSVAQSGNSVVYLTWNQAKVGLRYFSTAGDPGSLLGCL